MILLSELSRRRIRSVNKLIRIGRTECVVVIRVDKDKGYIDLSKRRVDAKDVAACHERYAKAKAMNSILRHVAEQLGFTSDEQLEDLYERVVWHFDKKKKRKAAAYDTFLEAVTDSTVFDECDITQDVKDKLIEDIRKKLTPKAVKIRADFEVNCFAYEGVEAVKDSLIEGKKLSTESMPIKINLIAAPQFVITTQTMEHEKGLETINQALEVIKNKIESYGGSFSITSAPRVLTDLEEDENKLRLEDEEESDYSTEGEDDDGLIAPKGLNEEADKQEANKLAEDSD